MNLSRRALIEGLIALPSATILLPSCGRPPETPLAHLHGQAWVHGAYQHYADKYVNLQTSAETQSQSAYAVIAQKGVVSLDALQSREVPFHIRVDGERAGFKIERNLPERLTFTADMSEDDRKLVTENWSKAREHIHTDYAEIRRMNWALTALFEQLQKIRSAVENGRFEQYRLVRQLDGLAQGKLPFELPYQVTKEDYERVLYLLVERLDDDRDRLENTESAIVAVGLTARATDAGSGSLSANLHEVLLAVVADAESSRPRPSTYPASDAHDAQVAKGKERVEAIRKDTEYAAWLREERNREFQQVGFLLAVFDQITGVQTSVVFRQVIDIFSGDADYLTYLQAIAGLVPIAGRLSGSLTQAIETTRKVRDAAGKLKGAYDDAAAINAAVRDAGVVNVGSQYARKRLTRQLSFFKNRTQLDDAAAAIRDSSLMKAALPDV